MSITGTLNNWRYDKLYDVYRGHLDKDAKGRFAPNEPIRTSTVVKVEGNLVFTLNSIYKLGEPAHD